LATTIPASQPDRLQIGEAFRFVFRSKAWAGKMLLYDLFVLLSVVLIGAFFLYGYLVEISRRVRRGDRELPPWDDLGKKFVDGLLLIIVFLVWAIPPLILSGLSGPTASCTTTESASATCTPNGFLVTLVVLLGILLYVLLPGIWAQFLEGGLRAALNVPAVFRRAAFRPGLTVLVIVMLFILWGILAFAGLIAIVIGVLFTYPYGFFIGGHLLGQYARITDVTAPGRMAVSP
jgi:uncharacterized protein DUF4013